MLVAVTLVTTEGLCRRAPVRLAGSFGFRPSSVSCFLAPGGKKQQTYSVELTVVL